MDLVSVLMLWINAGRFFMDLLNFMDKQHDKEIYPNHLKGNILNNK